MGARLVRFTSTGAVFVVGYRVDFGAVLGIISCEFAKIIESVDNLVCDLIAIFLNGRMCALFVSNSRSTGAGEKGEKAWLVHCDGIKPF